MNKTRSKATMSRTKHLLTILGEECNEVAQRISKALRFGLEEKEPNQDKTNAERIVLELVDEIAVLIMLFDAGVLEELDVVKQGLLVAAKQTKVEEHLNTLKSVDR
jgi:hypothetical protein